MSWNPTEHESSIQTNTSAKYSYFDFLEKPLEMYVFIDPLCPECWAMEPSLKKLSIEFGRFFTFNPIISGQLHALNSETIHKPNELRDTWELTAKRTGMSCDGDLWLENPIASPWIASLAIKAAELQGKKAGRIFLRRLQESAFLLKKDISKEEILIECAYKAELDVQEFQNDLFSTSAKKALQCDLKLTQEMEVDRIPTIVFFNQFVDEPGIKITGLHSYETYVEVLKEILQKVPLPSEKPPLEDFLSFYRIVGTKEVSVVYDWNLSQSEKELKKLQLKRKVKCIPAKYGSFWKYIS